MTRLLAALLALSVGPALAQPSFSSAALSSSTTAAAAPLPPVVPSSATATAGVNNLLLAARPVTIAYLSVCANGTEPLYMRLYDQATAANGTQTPLFRMQIPSNACSTVPAGLVAVSVGLAVTITPVEDDTDQSPVTASEFFLNTGLRG